MRPEPTTRGVFIVFEGGDGSGKSTQAQLLADELGAVLTREPGGTPTGEAIRAVVLDPDHAAIVPRTEALLMAASRAQHVDELIEPTLASGRHVVSDRFVASSLAYQGIGRGLGVDPVAEVNAFATAGLIPDLTVLLDVPAADARSRLGDDLDRIEAAGSRLGQIAAQAYRDFATQDPERWAVVPAVGDIDQVFSAVRQTVRDRLGL